MIECLAVILFIGAMSVALVVFIAAGPKIGN